METNKELMARNLVDVALGVLSAWGKPVAELGERSTEKLCKELQSEFAAALSQRSEAVPEGYVLAPHYRGYAHLGTGNYILNHSCAGDPAEFVASIATEAEKDGRVVGDLQTNSPDALVQPDAMAVRIRFENVAGLDALEQQLRLLRVEHFPESLTPAAQPAPAQGDAVPVATKCAACNGEGWVRDIHDMEQGRIRCTKCATRQSSADAVDAAKWREWAAMCKRVDSELPDGWLITYDMGPEVWGVSLRNPDGEHVGFHTCDCESDAEMVICALDAAIAAQGGKGEKE